MANPQLEQGYTRIANEILEALSRQPLNGTQWRILLVVFRFTYGFQRLEAELSESFISTATCIDRRNIRREINDLICKKLVIVIRDASFSKPRVIRFNKNYGEWVRANLPPQGEKVTEGKRATTPGGELAPTPEGELTPQERKHKENINKYALDSFFEDMWQQYPKKKGKGQVSKAQKERLYKIGRDEVSRAIERYKKETAGRDPLFIMYGSTFFNSGYVDYLDKNYDQGSHHQQSGGDNTYGYQDFTGRFRD